MLYKIDQWEVACYVCADNMLEVFRSLTDARALVYAHVKPNDEVEEYHGITSKRTRYTYEEFLDANRNTTS